MNKICSVLVILALVSCKVQETAVVSQDPIYIKQFHSGVRNMLNEQYETAIQEFKACLTKQPKDAAVHYALFQIYLKQERYQEAAYHTEQAAALDPSNLHYKRELAFMYQQLGKSQEAASVFEALLKADPKNIDYYSGALKSYDDLKKPSKSYVLIEKMEQQLGENPNTVLEKFRLLQQMGKTKDGVALLEAARVRFPSEPSILANLVDHYFRTQNYTAGFGLLKDLVAADPENGVALLMYGEMLYRSGKVDEGKKYLHAGILAQGPSLDQKMNILIMLVNEKQQAAIDPQLEPLVQYMSDTYPNEAKAHSIAGDYYYVAGQTKKAIDCYRQTLRCDPNLYPVWNQVLILEFEQERWTDLEQDASTCAELFPSYPIPFFFKGYALSRKGAYSAALENFSLAKGVLVNDNALLAEIFMQEGSAYLGLNKQDQAFAAFKEALTISSNGLELSYLHNLLKYKIELVKTTERLQELAAKDPSNLNITFEYAFAQFQAGAYQKALDEMRKISNASLAQTAAYQELLGDIYFHLTQVQDANDSWQKALLYGEGSAVLADKINQKKYVQAP
ncbi:MAG: tetratricopeptide repeat protein [Flavobacteriia bacterium]|jgi:tetratricopeptide (TPR) repeat protein